MKEECQTSVRMLLKYILGQEEVTLCYMIKTIVKYVFSKPFEVF